MDVIGQVHAPTGLPQGRTAVSTEQEVRWVAASEWTFWKRDKFFPCPGSNRGSSSPQLIWLKQGKTLTLSPSGNKPFASQTAEWASTGPAIICFDFFTIASRITGFKPYSTLATIRITCYTIQKLHSVNPVYLCFV